MQKPKELLKDILIDAARENYSDFLELIDEDYHLTWFHKEIADKLQEAYEKVKKGEKSCKIIIEMPPQHGKSQEATIMFPAWILGNHPEWSIITTSYSDELATKFGFKTRDIINKPIYRKIFNTKIRQDSRAKGNWITEEGGGYLSAGIGGTITGMGFKVGIIDDPFKNRKEAESKLIRDNVWDYFTSVFMTRQQGATLIVVINTRWNKDDLIGRIEAKENEAMENKVINYDKWEYLTFPAIAEKDEKCRKRGEALWPERFPLSFLEEAKNRSIYDFYSLYQQHPIATESQEFREEWFKRIKYPPMYNRKFATIDPAFKKQEETDNTGVVKNYVDKDNFWYIKGTKYKINSKDCIDLIFKLHDEGFEIIGIEEGAYEITIRPFFDEECRKRNKFPNVVGLKHRSTSKEMRIRSLIPRYMAGQIYHISGECNDLEEELTSFPRGINDDIIDALAYQFEIAKSPDDNSVPRQTFEIKNPGAVW